MSYSKEIDFNGDGIININDLSSYLDDYPVTQSYKYDPFGNRLDKLDAYDTNPFQYCGEYWDKETGEMYLRARYYVPTIGRFTTVDPAMDGVNWYVYCGNNPVMYVDPDGKIAIQLGSGFAKMLIDTSYLAFTDAIKGEFSSWGEYAGTAIGGFVSGVVSSTPGCGLIGPYVGVVVHSIVKNAVDGTFSTEDVLTDIIIDSISTMVGQRAGMHIGNAPVSRQQVRKALREAGKAYSGQALQVAVKNAKTKNAVLKDIVENITQIVTDELLSNTTINLNDNEDEDIVDEYNNWKTYNDNN